MRMHKPAHLRTAGQSDSNGSPFAVFFPGPLFPKCSRRLRACKARLQDARAHAVQLLPFTSQHTGHAGLLSSDREII